MLLGLKTKEARCALHAYLYLHALVGDYSILFCYSQIQWKAIFLNAGTEGFRPDPDKCRRSIKLYNYFTFITWIAMTRKHLQIQESPPYSAGPPWIFRGRAFYQLHLVKTEVAKRFIPSELQIVQAFGYTLGGLYLAQYDSSPAGAFDELVVIAGTVWNPPTSCAWAGRVLVNSAEACSHGKKEVGLPSKEATFSHVVTPVQKQKSWWQWNPFSKLFPGQRVSTIMRPLIHIAEMDGLSKRPLCEILFPFDRAQLKENQWVGPTISMSLPSFSGKTSEQPDLLKYSCQLKCSVRAVKPAAITTSLTCEGAESGGHLFYKSILAILAAKPVLALCFEKMVMHVEAPTIMDSNRTLSYPVTPKVNVTSPVAVKVL